MSERAGNYIVLVTFERKEQAENFLDAYNRQPIGYNGYSIATGIRHYHPLFSTLDFIRDLPHNIKMKYLETRIRIGDWWWTIRH